MNRRVLRRIFSIQSRLAVYLAAGVVLFGFVAVAMIQAVRGQWVDDSPAIALVDVVRDEAPPARYVPPADVQLPFY